MRKHLLKNIAAGLLVAASAHAATATFDLNTDPTGGGLFFFTGSAAWQATGGVTNSGFIKLTDATGQTAAVLFPDFDGGLVVKAFTFECMIKCGDWYGNPPADGFSVNYARGTDPIIALVEGGTDPGRGQSGPGWAGSQDNGGTEIDLPEEGTQTGIGIGFDTWGTGDAPVGGSNGANDVRGISVRVDGSQKAQVAMPGVVFPDGDNHDFANDATTLITGPFSNGPDPANANQGNPDNGDGTTAPPALGNKLVWVPLKVSVDENGILNVFWKNVNIVSNLVTTFGPGPGRIIFGASTGGAMEFAGIDNIQITTVPSDKALVSSVTGLSSANGFKVVANDSGQSVVNTNGPTSLKLDGNSVTVTSITKTAAETDIFYQLPAGQVLPSGSAHSVDVSLTDTLGFNIVATNKTFTTITYSTVPSSDVVVGVDTTKPGFKVRSYQTSAGQPNTVAWTEEQLAGFHGANTANLTQILDGQAIDANGFYTLTGMVNWDGVELGRLDGNFTDNNGYTEVELPGAPPVSPAGLASDYNNLSEEVVTFLHFPAAGVYTMGVNSDDGFKVTTGPNPKDTFSSQNLGQFDGGRGSSDTTFNFLITQPGDYPFRLIWENGGGGANCEWFTMNADGSKVLINDPAGTNNTVKAYYSGPALPAYVSVFPQPNATGVFPDATVTAKVTDGANLVTSATLSVNGGAPVTGTKSGGVTTANVPSSPFLPPSSTNTATLVWTAGGVTTTNIWTFTVGFYATLPVGLSSPIGSGDTTKPGFTAWSYQVNNANGDTENNNVAAESELAGLYGPNVATLSAAGGAGWLSNNVFAVSTWINWDRGAEDGTAATDGNFTSNNGFPEDPVPGIVQPGGVGGALYEAVAVGVQTYVEFPAAGLYRMGVNSDDNFAVTVTEAAPQPAISISGPTNTGLAGVALYLRPGVDGGGRVNWGVQAATPITAPIVYMTPGGIDDPGPYPDVTGKIALLDRNGVNLGGNSTGGKTKFAQTAGAVAVLITTPTDTGYSGYAGGTRTDITIPSFIIPNPTAASLLKSYLTNGTAVTGTIRGDPAVSLGGFDNGRGATDTIFNFQVPQAGVYPMRMLFHQGGGGMNCEWFSLKADGSRVLVNDTANGGLKAYRARTFTPAPQFNPTTISGGNVTISWTGTGTLQQATALTGSAGDWTDVSPQPGGNTLTVTGATSGNKFYRLR